MPFRINLIERKRWLRVFGLMVMMSIKYWQIAFKAILNVTCSLFNRVDPCHALMNIWDQLQFSQTSCLQLSLLLLRFQSCVVSERAKDSLFQIFIIIIIVIIMGVFDIIDINRTDLGNMKRPTLEEMKVRDLYLLRIGQMHVQLWRHVHTVCGTSL